MKKLPFLLAAALPVLAHHSFSAEFDSNQKVVFSGSADDGGPAARTGGSQ
jgi:hypothetical protein